MALETAIAKNDLQEAIHAYEKLIELNPEEQLSHHNLACYYFAQALRENNPVLLTKAEASFQHALEMGPHSGLRTEYANFLYKTGHYQKAIGQLLQAIQLKEDQKGLSYGQLEINNLPEDLGREVAAQGSVGIKAVLFAYYLLVLSYKKTDQLKEAIALLPAYAKEVKETQEPLAYALLGYAYKEVGFYAEAADCFAKALILKSDYPLAIQNKEECLQLKKKAISSEEKQQTSSPAFPKSQAATAIPPSDFFKPVVEDKNPQAVEPARTLQEEHAEELSIEENQSTKQTPEERAHKKNCCVLV